MKFIKGIDSYRIHINFSDMNILIFLVLSLKYLISEPHITLLFKCNVKVHC